MIDDVRIVRSHRRPHRDGRPDNSGQIVGTGVLWWDHGDGAWHRCPVRSDWQARRELTEYGADALTCWRAGQTVEEATRPTGTPSAE